MTVFDQITLEGESPVLGWQVIYTGFGTQFFHQRIAAVVTDQFAETRGFFGGSVGDSILIAVAKPVSSIRAGRYAGGQFSIPQPVSRKQAFLNRTFFLRHIGFYVVGNSFIFFCITRIIPVKYAG